MSITKITFHIKSFSSIFSDKNLTKKASLNALASVLDYIAKMAVGFVITPMMVAGLGDYFYGVWQIMNRIFSYISTTSGSTSSMEWTLAKEQNLDNYEMKRRYVGSAVIIWGIFFPIMGVIGGLISWFMPNWINTAPEYIWQIRIVAGIFVLLVASQSLSFLPYAILRGQNQAYRRLGTSVIVFFFNGGLTWLALYLNTGIIGVSASFLVQSLIIGIFYMLVCRAYIPWFGIRWPSLKLIQHFLSLSWWFLAWDIVQSMTTASDVIVLGLLNSVESVTSYTLTKYIPEMVITIIAIMVVGIIPGLGGIIGTGDLKKAAQVRGEIYSLSWLVMTVIGTSILLWDRLFLGLWVGSERYSGTLPAFMIMLVVVQFIFIRIEGFIIDLTLRIERKVIYGALSALVAIIIAAILVKFFDLGIVGVSLGLILGRSILSVAYPKIISRFLGISIFPQIKNIIRPACVMALLYIMASLVDSQIWLIGLSGLRGWIFLIFGAGLTTAIVLMVAFFGGLSRVQRDNILLRVQTMVSYKAR